ncbi:MAG TPA: hypothetical protein DFR83_23765 [Deltaproteobacteria bacterium]|nr:hypothetical protein [Deltaproteobacteria bacterium]
MIPRVSLLMPTYRAQHYVGAALQSALAQTWPNLEVVLCDDASDDDTWREVQRVVADYRGPHTLTVHRQERNLGPYGNGFDTLRRSTGEVVAFAYGDDISVPRRIERLMAVRAQTGAKVVSSAYLMGPDPSGAPALVKVDRPAGIVPVDELLTTSWNETMLGASYLMDREIWSFFGIFDDTLLARGGDHVIPLRGALLGGFAYVPEPLLFWRRHAEQVTLAVADYEGSTAAFGETDSAYRVAAQLQRLRDIETLAGTVRAPAQLEHYRSLAIHRVAGTLVEWRRYRGQLDRAGLSLHWGRR